MPSIIQAPHGGITLNAEEAKEYIWLPVVAYGGLEDFFLVLTDIKVKQQVGYVQYFDKITHIDTGCDSAAVNRKLVFTEKFWEPNPVEAMLNQCYTDLYGITFQKTLRGGTEKYNLEGTPVEQLMLTAMVYAGDLDLKRMVWLGNKDIQSANLTKGADGVGNYNQVNGIWKRLKTAAIAQLTPRYVIDKNTASTTAGQQLADGQAVTILQGVFRNQKLVLKQMNKKAKKFFVSGSIYDNYSEWLSANDKLESARTKLLNGVETLTYEGIPLEVVDIVDTYLSTDFTFGTGANQTITDPHRVALTIKDNFQFSVDTSSTYPVSFETWTEKKEKRWYGR